MPVVRLAFGPPNNAGPARVNGVFSSTATYADAIPPGMRPLALPGCFVGGERHSRLDSPKHLGRADQQRLAGDVVAGGQEHQVVPPWLVDDHAHIAERHLRGHPRVGLVERTCGPPPPYNVAGSGPQFERQVVRAAAAPGVGVDRHDDVGGELRDRGCG